MEGRRAHNICIELSGVHLDVAVIRAALTSMRTDHLSVDALGVLQRAVPTEHEAADIRLFLAGKHPRYRGMSDANALGACERCAPPSPTGLSPHPRLCRAGGGCGHDAASAGF